MIRKEQYEALKAKHKEGLANNDYNKMIMMGSSEYDQMKEYEQQYCDHKSIETLGGTDICKICGKQW